MTNANRRCVGIFDERRVGQMKRWPRCRGTTRKEHPSIAGPKPRLGFRRYDQKGRAGMPPKGAGR